MVATGQRQLELHLDEAVSGCNCTESSWDGVAITALSAVASWSTSTFADRRVTTWWVRARTSTAKSVTEVVDALQDFVHEDAERGPAGEVIHR